MEFPIVMRSDDEQEVVRFLEYVEISTLNEPIAVCIPQRHLRVLQEKSASIDADAMREQLVQVLRNLQLIFRELGCVLGFPIRL